MAIKYTPSQDGGGNSPVWGITNAIALLNSGLDTAGNIIPNYQKAKSQKAADAFNMQLAQAQSVGDVNQLDPFALANQRWVGADTATKAAEALELRKNALNTQGQEELKAQYGTAEFLEQLRTGQVTKDQFRDMALGGGRIKDTSVEPLYQSLLTQAETEKTRADKILTDRDTEAVRLATEEMARNPNFVQALATGEADPMQIANHFGMRPEVAKKFVTDSLAKHTGEQALVAQQQANAAIQNMTMEDMLEYASGAKSLSDFSRENPQLAGNQASAVYSAMLQDIQSRGVGALTPQQQATADRQVSDAAAQIDTWKAAEQQQILSKHPYLNKTVLESQPISGGR